MPALPLYTRNVHSVKSALMGVGRVGLAAAVYQHIQLRQRTQQNLRVSRTPQLPSAEHRIHSLYAQRCHVYSVSILKFINVFYGNDYDEASLCVALSMLMIMNRSHQHNRILYIIF